YLRRRRSIKARRCVPALARRPVWLAVIECRPQAARTWRGRRSERCFRQSLTAPECGPARGSDIPDEPRKAHDVRHGRLPGRSLLRGRETSRSRPLVQVWIVRHCERSEASHFACACVCGGDCFVGLRPPRNDRALLFAPSEWRAFLLHQFHHRPRLRLVAQADRDRHARTRAHIGDAARLPVLLADHVADHGNLLDHALGDKLLGELMPMTVRTHEPLRKQTRAAARASPDADAPAHPTRSRMAAAAVPPYRYMVMAYPVATASR